MKYFIADPDAEGGVVEADASDVAIIDGSKIEYRLPGAAEKRVADGFLWSDKREEVVRPAYGMLIRAKNRATKEGDTAELVRIDRAMSLLVASSDELEKLENQALFKETKF
jgi:hypothetical protein